MACLNIAGKQPSVNERLASLAMSSEKIAGQALNREVGIKSRGDDLQVMLARMLWTSSAVTRRMLLKEGPEYGGEVNSGNVPRDTSVNFKVCLRLATLSTKY